MASEEVKNLQLLIGPVFILSFLGYCRTMAVRHGISVDKELILKADL